MHVSRADDIVVAGRVLVLDAALEGDGNCLEATVRVLAHAEPLLGRVELHANRVCGVSTAVWRG